MSKGERRMVCRSTRMRMLALVMSLLTIVFGAQISTAENVAVSPLGTIVTQGNVIVGNAFAPTGTTIFAGDKVTSTQPSLINFDSGSRVEMTKAAATFSRQGKTLIVKADEGLLRFNFKQGESVQIDAGKFQITGTGNSNHIGELGLSSKGQIIMTVAEGSFSALNTETGTRTEVTPTKPLSSESQASAALGAGSATTSSAVSTAGVVGSTAASAVGTIVGIKEAVKSPHRR